MTIKILFCFSDDNDDGIDDDYDNDDEDDDNDDVDDNNDDDDDNNDDDDDTNLRLIQGLVLDFRGEILL